MGSVLVVVEDVFRQKPFQMALIEGNDMMLGFEVSERSISRCMKRAPETLVLNRCGRDLLGPHMSHSTPEERFPVLV